MGGRGSLVTLQKGAEKPTKKEQQKKTLSVTQQRKRQERISEEH